MTDHHAEAEGNLAAATNELARAISQFNTSAIAHALIGIGHALLAQNTPPQVINLGSRKLSAEEVEKAKARFLARYHDTTSVDPNTPPVDDED